MRVPSLTLAVASAALLASTLPDSGLRGRTEPVGWRERDVRAADLLARVRHCDQISRGRYRSDEGRPADIPVCGARGAVFWKADMDIDCDGRPGARCNRRADPSFVAATAFQQSDRRFPSAERLPYIVVPGVSRIWNHGDHGVRGGSVAAVVYRKRVRYAVVGDVGPRNLIGEASYATAKALGIPTDPRGGGAPSGVTYIVFKNSQAAPIEDHDAAVRLGRRLARKFAQGGR
ncbi:glycoside hydrolase family 75 protein [Streptomyces sp. NPDC001663]|uniref:glycoside hydrolase family 75 protein n=1 Tax=Streptomyces sp. NPDC001663 TaxID=3364597 RepID=UPI0036B514B3